MNPPLFFFCVVVTKTVTVLASSSTVTGLDVHSGCKRIRRKGSTSMTCIRKYFHICALGLEEQGTSMLHSWRVSCSSAKYSPFHWQKALKLLYAPEIHFQGMLLFPDLNVQLFYYCWFKCLPWFKYSTSGTLQLSQLLIIIVTTSFRQFNRRIPQNYS